LPAAVPVSSPRPDFSGLADQCAIRAAMCGDAMLDDNDMDGRAVWLRMLKAANKLFEVVTGTLGSGLALPY
jgi:hypothetical protein